VGAEQPGGPPRSLNITIVGGGWAGLAAAVATCEQGHRVRLLELAPQLGGRARSLAAPDPALRLDNGQHILIGAYRATLALMRRVGVDPAEAFLRTPLSLLDANGRGLRLPPGPAIPAFVRAVVALHEWPLRDRLALLAAAGHWALRGFRCPAHWTVARLSQTLPERVRLELIDPLCVAALNTPSQTASASIFLRVLKDALFSGPGAADLLLPRQPLAALLPEPAGAWLQRRGATLQLGTRADSLEADGAGWRVNGTPCDAVILACSATEAARLTANVRPDWAQGAAGFAYEPIITVYLQCQDARLIAPMVALPTDAPEREPAQFAFDLGAIAGPHLANRFAYVISGAADWAARGLKTTEEAVRVQAAASLHLPQRSLDRIQVVQTVAEKRATFRCTPSLARPAAAIAPGLWAAGDYVAGPYPATLEGAVRSGLAAAAALQR
jgi:squalene-associated FAD-dependent desaturase